MIKKIQLELIVLIVLGINIFFSYSPDILTYNFFSNLNYGFETSYLKNFFIGITNLGDSLWYFLIIISVLLLAFVAKKTRVVSLNNYLYLRNFSIFSFVYLFLVGLITQILKHIIGRPRPNHVDFENGGVFQFFSTDASFHSFPSGHSSTIFAIVIIISLLVPSLRIFFFIIGFVVAISRVVVGAHFITDVIAGGLVAIIFFKIFLSLVEKRYKNFSANRFKIKNTNLLLKTNVVFLIMGILVTFGSAIDVFLSDIFFKGNEQFFLQSYNALSIVFREILLPFLVIYIFVLPIIGNFIHINKIYFGHKFGFREIVFIWTTGILSLILIVNILLKGMWGRTRPNDILQFGGTDVFSPWYRFGDSCFSNCSFVSGDASVGFALIIFYFITKKNIFIYLSIFFGVILGFVRIVAGAHFLSDVIFSQIIVTAIIFISFIIYKKTSNE